MTVQTHSSNSQQSRQIAIIGAGVAGLSAAWDLARAGHRVTIYEAGSEVGGLAAGFRDTNWEWTLEKFYHHWFETDSELLRLADEVGVRDKIFFPRPKTSYWLDNQIVRSEMTPYSVLFKLPLSMVAKFRVALAGAYLKYVARDWHGLEKVTAHDWLQRYMGPEAYSKLWQPLLIGKFSDLYQRVNMAWLWARIKTRSLRLGTYEGGFQAFINDLAAAVERLGVEICLNSPVQHITQDGEKLALTVGGETLRFDQVLSTLGPGLMLKIVDGLPETEYGKKASQLQSIGAVCVVFALKQSLLTDGTYWLNLPATSSDKTRSEFPFLALVEHTNWMDKVHYGGDVLVYCGDYVSAGHEYLTMPEDELAQRFMAVLPRFNPAFRPEWVRKSWVFRAPYAQPIPEVNQSQRVPTIETPLKGLYWASMSHVYPWDRGTNFAVEIGRRAAHHMLEASSRTVDKPQG